MFVFICFRAIHLLPENTWYILVLHVVYEVCSKGSWAFSIIWKLATWFRWNFTSIYQDIYRIDLCRNSICIIKIDHYGNIRSCQVTRTRSTPYNIDLNSFQLIYFPRLNHPNFAKFRLLIRWRYVYRDIPLNGVIYVFIWNNNNFNNKRRLGTHLKWRHPKHGNTRDHKILREFAQNTNGNHDNV